MQTNNNPDLHKPTMMWPILAYAIPIFLASLIITGYRVYFHNQALQIPLIYQINDPGLYPHDPFAQTLPHYASLLWWPVAWLTRLLPLETLFPIMFLFERALVLFAAAYLAWTFAPGSKLAAVSAMAWFALGPLPILGGGTLITSYPEQTGLAIPCLLLAIAFFYKSRTCAWAIAMAVAFGLNSMYATFGMVYCAAVLLSAREYRIAWKQWVPAIALFLVLASPAIIMTLSAISRPAGSRELWMAASRFRVPHHIYPSTWATARYLQFAILLAATILILARNRNLNPRLYHLGVVYGTMSAIWLIVADTAVRLKSPTMMVMQSARATDFWYAFTAIAIVSTCSVWLSQPRNRTLGAAVLLAALVYCTPFGTPANYAVLAALALAYHLYTQVRETPQPERLASLVAVIVVVFAVTSPISRRGSAAPLISTPAPSVMQMANWAKTRTGRDAVFLVNPNMGAFRALSKRSAFVTWKDGSALLWDRAYAGEWVKRMDALGCDICNHPPEPSHVTRDLDRLYNALSDRSVARLSSRYRIDYWLVSPSHKSQYPTVYQNSAFKVLEVTKTTHS